MAIFSVEDFQEFIEFIKKCALEYNGYPRVGKSKQPFSILYFADRYIYGIIYHCMKIDILYKKWKLAVKIALILTERELGRGFSKFWKTSQPLKSLFFWVDWYNQNFENWKKSYSIYKYEKGDMGHDKNYPCFFRKTRFCKR